MFLSRAVEPSEICRSTESRILELIDSANGKKLLFHKLLPLYEKRYSETLDYRSKGFKILSEYLAQYKTIQMREEKGNKVLSRAPANPGINGTSCDLRSNISKKHGVLYVDSVDQLEELQAVFPFDPLASTPSGVISNGLETVVALDCEGVPENLYLVQVAVSEDLVYVFDGVELGERELIHFLSRMLSDPKITKLMHDCHKDSIALQHSGLHLSGTLDTQLAMEEHTGSIHIGLNQMLSILGLETNDMKLRMKAQVEGGRGFASRPLSRELLQYAVDDVRLLLKAAPGLQRMLGESWSFLRRASDERARNTKKWAAERIACFDGANQNRVASSALLNELRPSKVRLPRPIEVKSDIGSMLSLLPQDIVGDLMPFAEDLTEIQLDVGRRPMAWCDRLKKDLGCTDRIISTIELENIAKSVGRFGSDNRAAMEGQLHRISAIRNLSDEIIGLTLRVGRQVTGVTETILDLLDDESEPSILFLGKPGSSKTTIIREIAKILAEQSNVCVVDTSNEIAGDGDMPHECIGKARRMMVPFLKQKSVMIECVQNHTPHAMVIDEIGRPKEVKAAKTCKNRGVRLIASVHGGGLRQLVDNSDLCGLVGGVKEVILSDLMADIRGSQKLV